MHGNSDEAVGDVLNRNNNLHENLEAGVQTRLQKAGAQSQTNKPLPANSSAPSRRWNYYGKSKKGKNRGQGRRQASHSQALRPHEEKVMPKVVWSLAVLDEDAVEVDALPCSNPLVRKLHSNNDQKTSWILIFFLA